ncbi:homeobox protein 2-like [Condylostylus longicornis]|uniref:homeobox protein 2-like n=1 Tax=Condylostylus longicornis TaxID=2530218 RepID=UPI00244DEB8F|nr:homeobox protein 2-like [Condylostylus longicornis]
MPKLIYTTRKFNSIYNSTNCNNKNNDSNITIDKKCKRIIKTKNLISYSFFNILILFTIILSAFHITTSHGFKATASVDSSSNSIFSGPFSGSDQDFGSGITSINDENKDQPLFVRHRHHHELQRQQQKQQLHQQLKQQQQQHQQQTSSENNHQFYLSQNKQQNNENLTPTKHQNQNKYQQKTGKIPASAKVSSILERNTFSQNFKENPITKSKNESIKINYQSETQPATSNNPEYAKSTSNNNNNNHHLRHHNRRHQTSWEHRVFPALRHHPTPPPYLNLSPVSNNVNTNSSYSRWHYDNLTPSYNGKQWKTNTHQNFHHDANLNNNNNNNNNNGHLSNQIDQKNNAFSIGSGISGTDIGNFISNDNNNNNKKSHYTIGNNNMNSYSNNNNQNKNNQYGSNIGISSLPSSSVQNYTKSVPSYYGNTNNNDNNNNNKNNNNKNREDPGDSIGGTKIYDLQNYHDDSSSIITTNHDTHNDKSKKTYLLKRKPIKSSWSSSSSSSMFPSIKLDKDFDRSSTKYDLDRNIENDERFKIDDSRDYHTDKRGNVILNLKKSKSMKHYIKPIIENNNDDQRIRKNFNLKSSTIDNYNSKKPNAANMISNIKNNKNNNDDDEYEYDDDDDDDNDDDDDEDEGNDDDDDDDDDINGDDVDDDNDEIINKDRNNSNRNNNHDDDDDDDDDKNNDNDDIIENKFNHNHLNINIRHNNNNKKQRKIINKIKEKILNNEEDYSYQDTDSSISSIDLNNDGPGNDNDDNDDDDDNDSIDEDSNESKLNWIGDSKGNGGYRKLPKRKTYQSVSNSFFLF